MNDDRRIQLLLRNIHYNKWIHLVDKHLREIIMNFEN